MFCIWCMKWMDREDEFFYRCPHCHATLFTGEGEYEWGLPAANLADTKINTNGESG
jgi:uncharacterized C2H2 Zn-finger protein